MVYYYASSNCRCRFSVVHVTCLWSVFNSSCSGLSLGLIGKRGNAQRSVVSPWDMVGCMEQSNSHAVWDLWVSLPLKRLWQVRTRYLRKTPQESLWTTKWRLTSKAGASNQPPTACGCVQGIECLVIFYLYPHEYNSPWFLRKSGPWCCWETLSSAGFCVKL